MNVVVFTLLAQLSVGISHANDWNGYNDPSHFSDHYEYRLSALPQKGAVAPKNLPWSETYWPSDKGSINYRWNAQNPIGFDYGSPSREEALKMSRDELARLAPAEKYDLAMGNYDYPLKGEVAASAGKHAKDWAGICNGWVPAAIQFPEPKAVDYVNPDGIVIPFGASDVKGLLSYMMAFHVELGVVQVGRRCSKIDHVFGRGTCVDDINPGAMHVILANELGLHHQGFAANVALNAEVWNQPIIGYEVQTVGSALSNHSAQAVHVKLRMDYVDELDASQWEPVIGTSLQQFNHQDLEYTLEMDENGAITGGSWITKHTHPNFFWKATELAKFEGDYAGLAKIYQPAKP